MNDRELHERLKAWTAPKPPPHAIENAWRRAEIAFAQPAVKNKPAGLLFHLAYLALPLVILFAFVFIGYFRPARAINTKGSERAILSEMVKLFPSELQSVTLQDGEVEVEVGRDSSASPSQPVSLRFLKNGRETRILASSGSRISLPSIPGQWEVLATHDGQFLLVGEEALLNLPSSDSRGRIEAIRL